MKTLTYLQRAEASLADVQKRMVSVGLLPTGVTLALKNNDAGWWVAYMRDGDVWRTTSAIGPTTRDAYLFIRGYASAVFSATEHAYMTGESVTPVFAP